MSLPDVSGRETIKALSKIGFRVIRQRGSHIRLEKINEEIIKLTVPLHKSLKKGNSPKNHPRCRTTVKEFNQLL